MGFDQTMYEIACTFPTMKYKGVKEGDIPGISPDSFEADELSDFLYNGGGGAWSSGEFLVLEFLLNIYDPVKYKDFNLGKAVNVLDPTHMNACLKAVVRIYNGQ